MQNNTAAQTQKQTILIVDDDKQTTEFISLVLESQNNCNILVASSGAQAVEIAKNRAPDIILLDIMMPGMNGIETFRQIKDIDNLIPPAVFFITARRDREDIIKGIQLGAEDYIEKPFDAAILREKVQSRLQKINQIKKNLFADPLTGVYNNPFFLEKLSQACKSAARNKRAFSVMFIDLDDFKSVNDNYGHLTGDNYLRASARLMQEFFRESDIIARYGGDEFGVFLPEADSKKARSCAKRLETTIKNAVFTCEDGTQIPIKFSIGTATYSTRSRSPEELIAKADAAMYRQKFKKKTKAPPSRN